MPPDRNLRLSLLWRFDPLEDANGWIRWHWRALNHRGEVELSSEATFETLAECIEDAKRHGYVEPEAR